METSLQSSNTRYRRKIRITKTNLRNFFKYEYLLLYFNYEVNLVSFDDETTSEFELESDIRYTANMVSDQETKLKSKKSLNNRCRKFLHFKLFIYFLNLFFVFVILLGFLLLLSYLN